MYDIFEQLLQKRGLTSYKVAKEAGVTQTALSNWKSGKSTPTTKTLQKIADYFGVTIDYLMTGEEKDSESAYYLNDETARLAQEMFEDEDMRSLFHMKRTMPPERFKAHMDFMKNLYNQENGDF